MVKEASNFDPDRVSKRRLVAEYEKMREIANRYLRLSFLIAVELYRRDPDARPFRDGTFVPDSVLRIRAECGKVYRCRQHRGWPFRALRWLLGRLVPARKREEVTRGAVS